MIDLSSNTGEVIEATFDHLDAFEERVDDEIDRTVEEAQSMAKRRVPVDTGALREDISIDLQEDKVYNTLPYAPAQNFGAEPHEITPSDAEVLHFEVDGEEVFAQKVDHPGNPPTWYMTDSALDAFFDSIDRLTK